MIVYGKQIVFYYLQNYPNLIEEIYLAKELDKDTFKQFAKLGVKINKLDFIKAQSMAKGGNHQGFLANVKKYTLCELSDLKKADKLVVLHELSDVGNIGAIIRTAYALGFDGVVHSGNSINLSAVMRASAGALLDMKLVLIKDILSFINEFKQIGFAIYAANNSLNAREHNKINYQKKLVLLMGSEGQGLSGKIIKTCTDEVKITMRNNFDSLNVSSAFAILGDRIMNE